MYACTYVCCPEALVLWTSLRTRTLSLGHVAGDDAKVAGHLPTALKLTVLAHKDGGCEPKGRVRGSYIH